MEYIFLELFNIKEFQIKYLQRKFKMNGTS
jgi:hypothetical protein